MKKQQPEEKSAGDVKFHLTFSLTLPRNPTSVCSRDGAAPRSRLSPPLVTPFDFYPAWILAVLVYLFILTTIRFRNISL